MVLGFMGDCTGMFRCHIAPSGSDNFMLNTSRQNPVLIFYGPYAAPYRVNNLTCGVYCLGVKGRSHNSSGIVFACFKLLNPDSSAHADQARKGLSVLHKGGASKPRRRIRRLHKYSLKPAKRFCWVARLAKTSIQGGTGKREVIVTLRLWGKAMRNMSKKGGRSS